MNTLPSIVKATIVVVLVVVLSGCFSEKEDGSVTSKNPIAQETLYVESGDLVEVTALGGGESYDWQQLSGTEVPIDNKGVATLAFTAPDVTEKTELVFELKAKFDDPVQDQITITVFPVLIINDVRLPPEPTPEENNATLLGVDSNNNQVRDDVERWIYTTFQDKHPVHIEVGMQSARTWERIFEGGADKALETVEFVHAALGCQIFYEGYSEPLLIVDAINVFAQVKREILNTSERTAAFLTYDKALSGGVYTLPDDDELEGMCDFDTDKTTGEH